MQNKFIRINTILGGIRYINISHIVCIQDSVTVDETQITTTTNTIYSKEPAVILLERIHKIQWTGETNNTNNNSNEI